MYSWSRFCELLTDGKQLPAFTHEVRPGFKLRSHRQEVGVLPLRHSGTISHLLPQPISISSIKFLRLTVFQGQDLYNRVKGKINVTAQCYISASPNQCPYQMSTFLHLSAYKIQTVIALFLFFYI